MDFSFTIPLRHKISSKKCHANYLTCHLLGHRKRCSTACQLQLSKLMSKFMPLAGPRRLYFGRAFCDRDIYACMCIIIQTLDLHIDLYISIGARPMGHDDQRWQRRRRPSGLALCCWQLTPRATRRLHFHWHMAKSQPWRCARTRLAVDIIPSGSANTSLHRGGRGL